MVVVKSEYICNQEYYSHLSKYVQFYLAFLFL